MQKIVNFIKYVFTGGTIGAIWKALFTNVKSTAVSIISDPETQAAALRFVTALAKSDKSSEEKKAEFNAALTEWAKATGKTIGTSALNCIRELALAAYNSSTEK